MIDETTKYVERRNLDKADALREVDKPKTARKEGKSPFDEMLDQSRQMQQGLQGARLQSKQATQQAVQELEKRQDREKDRSKDKDKEEDQRQESRDGKNETASVGKKVVGKAGLKQNQGDSGGRGSEEGGAGSKKGNRFASISKKWTSEEVKFQTASSPFGKEFQAELAKASTQLPKQLPQEILNQIVRYVRRGLSRNGHKEIELDLHKEVFKGLCLRISANRGKVKIHFLTASRGVKELFEKEASNIQQRLEAKGIAVEKITVT